MRNISKQEKVNIQLKEATLADIPTLIEIEKSITETNIYSPAVTENDWRELFQEGLVYLIKKDGTPVGDLSYKDDSKGHIHISGMAVRSSFQKQGIARDVMTKLLEQFKDAKRVDMVTHPDNEASLKLYKSLGFVVESRKENYFGDGEPRLVLALER